MSRLNKYFFSFGPNHLSENPRVCETGTVEDIFVADVLSADLWRLEILENPSFK